MPVGKRIIRTYTRTNLILPCLDPLRIWRVAPSSCARAWRAANTYGFHEARCINTMYFNVQTHTIQHIHADFIAYLPFIPYGAGAARVALEPHDGTPVRGRWRGGDEGGPEESEAGRGGAELFVC